MPRITALIGFCTCALAALLASAGARAQFTGDAVHVDYDYPAVGTVYEDLGTQTITPAGEAFYYTNGGVNTFETLVTPTTIDFFNLQGSEFTGPAVFNGFVITDLTSSLITSVTIASNNLAGFDSSRIEFTSNSVDENLQALNFQGGSEFQLDIGFESPPIGTPEPGPIALVFGLATVGSVAARRAGRRRAKLPASLRSTSSP
jgi:hypothetical protein